MTVTRKSFLRAEIAKSLHQADQQIWVLEEQAKDMDIPVSNLRFGDGTYPMIDLILAKAELLNALTRLETDKEK